MKPREQALDFPAAPVTKQYATILRRGFASRGVVRNNQLHTKTLTNLPIQWVTVVSAVAHQSFGSLGEETLLDRGSDELCFVRRSAGHEQGDLCRNSWHSLQSVIRLVSASSPRALRRLMW